MSAVTSTRSSRAASTPSRRAARLSADVAKALALLPEKPQAKPTSPLESQKTTPHRLLLRKKRPSALDGSPFGEPVRLPSLAVSKTMGREEESRSTGLSPVPTTCPGSALSGRWPIVAWEESGEYPSPPSSTPLDVGRPRPRRSKRSVTMYPTEPAPPSPQTSEASASGDRSACRVRRRDERRKTWAPSLVSTPSSVAGSLRSNSTCTSSPAVRDSSGPTSQTLCIQGHGWRRGSKIGRGSYGCVYKAQDKATGQIFAVKESVMDEREEESRKLRDTLEHELSICKELRHPHIVSYLGHDYEGSKLYIYLEYAAGGSVASVLEEFGPVEGRTLQRASRGLLEGLEYLHTREPPVVHRDIKAANVLVDLSFNVKLADFGCSKRNAVTKSFTTLGSIPWMAPEVIQQQDGYGRKADIWSLGCTIIEMATAEKPWGNGTFDNVMFALKHIGMSDATPPLPEGLCDSGRDLIDRCIRRRTEERPWTTSLLQHDFVQGLAAE